MSKLYAGITIGPIVDTLNLSSTPMGLWFSSYLFSTITRDMCNDLLKDKDIYHLLTLPESFEKDDKEIVVNPSDGIGQFHDRIYIAIDVDKKEELKERIEGLFDKVIANRAFEIKEALLDNRETLEEIKESIKNYFQFHYVIMELKEGDSICDKLAVALDSLELDQSYTDNLDKHFIKILIDGLSDNHNIYVKEYASSNHIKIKNLYEAEEDEKTSVNDLKDLVKNSVPTDIKANNYFAIIQADGDNMGKMVGSFAAMKNEPVDKKAYLNKLENQEKRIKKFSELCRQYAYASADKIHSFGGVVIYAGGDDLLFISPVIKKEKDGSIKDVWTLCQEIDNEFKAIFNSDSAKFSDIDGVEHPMVEFAGKPSLSFGVSINYVKYPLYEALGNGRDLLFDKAKNGTKNNIAINLHKHSGQSAECVFPLSINGKSDLFDSFENLSNTFKNAIENRETDNVLTSAVYHMEEMKSLLNLAFTYDSDFQLEKMMNNILDNQGIDNIKEIREKTLALAKNIKSNKNALTELNKDGRFESMLANMLRISKFLIERGEDE